MTGQARKSGPTVAQAVLICGGFFILACVAVFAWSAIDPEGYEAYSAGIEAERQAEKAARAAADREESEAFLAEAREIMAPCDRGFAGLLQQMQAGDVSMGGRTELYRLGEQTWYVCLSRGTDLRTLDDPRSFDGRQEDAADAMREACNDSMGSRAQFADAVKDVAEDGLSPSRASRIESMTSMGGEDAKACQAAFQELERLVAR